MVDGQDHGKRAVHSNGAIQIVTWATMHCANRFRALLSRGTVDTEPMVAKFGLKPIPCKDVDINHRVGVWIAIDNTVAIFRTVYRQIHAFMAATFRAAVESQLAGRLRRKDFQAYANESVFQAKDVA